MGYEIGKRIRLRRKQLKLTQKDLALKAGLTRSKIIRTETGKRKIDAVKELPRIAEVLRKPIKWFYARSETITEALEEKGIGLHEENRTGESGCITACLNISPSL